MNFTFTTYNDTEITAFRKQLRAYNITHISANYETIKILESHDALRPIVKMAGRVKATINNKLEDNIINLN